ncbi:MAG: DUF1573 domain-containing protein [Pseudomonadota bacterium]|nr:DUF1573 domain-containing protein [Planctomycetota bacterium]MBU1518693.1 DUF1573 domain-containing protein [Planctomycetota bacterium]MBU2457925.1 DUF1573 domain-containing protein [Planctomycetota bacterium]MBU2596750.1 DUF1573 domain-containing protein [Planctomycetota bacterium]
MKLTSIILAALFASALWAESPLLCENPLKDFGVIDEGQKISHIFAVKNISTKAISIDRVIPSCGCMITSKNEFKLEPNESTDIKVEVNSSGFGGLTILKTVSVCISGDEYAPLVLTIKAEVEGIPPERRIVVIPREKTIIGDSRKRYVLSLQVPADPNIEFSIDVPEWLVYSLQKSKYNDFPGIVNWDINLFLKKDESKKLDGNLIIYSNIPLFEKITVPIQIVPESLLTITPYMISFDNEPNQIRDIVIRPNKGVKGLPGKTLEIRPSQECLKTSWIIDNNEIRLKVSNKSCCTGFGKIEILADNELISTIPVVFK